MSIKTDTAWNIFGSGSPLLIAFLTIPWILQVLGAEGFGLLSLMWALVGYFGLFDLGIGRALTFELSKVEKGSAQLAGIVKSGLAVTVLMGVVGSLLIFFILAPMAHQWFHISSSSETAVDYAFKVVALAIIPSTITSAVRGALEGMDGFRKSNLIKMMLGIVTFGAPPLFIYFQQNGLLSAALGLVVGRVLVCLYAVYGIRFYLTSKLSNAIANARRLVGYGFWVTLSGIISPLMVYGDRFFVSSAIGAELLPFYAVPQEGMQRLLILPAAVASALLPRLVLLNKDTKLFEMYREHMWRVAVAMAIVCLAAVFIVPLVLIYWISPEFSDKTRVVVFCLAIGIWFNSMAQIPYSLLNAKGFPRIVAIIHLGELVLYVLVIYFLASRFGVMGAAIAWSLRAALDAFLLHFSAMRFTRGAE